LQVNQNTGALVLPSVSVAPTCVSLLRHQIQHTSAASV